VKSIETNVNLLNVCQLHVTEIKFQISVQNITGHCVNNVYWQVMMVRCHCVWLIHCQGYDNSESSVRKAAVFCLVAVYLVVGEELRPYLAALSASKVCISLSCTVSVTAHQQYVSCVGSQSTDSKVFTYII